MLKIKIGGQTVELQKSETFIGLKPHDHSGQQLDEEIEASDMQLAGRGLGGFEVVSTPDDVNAEERLDDFRARATVRQGTHVYQFAGSEAPLVPTGELYIVFRAGASHNACVALLNEFQLRLSQIRGPREIIAKTTPFSPNPLKVAAAMQAKEGLVEICEPNLAYNIQQCAVNIPNDEYFAQQWYLRNAGDAPGLKPGADVKVIEAWQALGDMGSPNIVVSVVDDGFDLSHPDFRDKIVGAFDFERKSNSNLLLRADDTHGTNCAGVAVAANNGSGIVGAAPNARFMPIRTFGIDDLIIERLCDYLIENGADVVSNSWGIPGKAMSTRAMNAFAKLATKGRRGRGTVVFFAAGNEGGSVSGFATHPNVICVGACSSLDRWSSYSNQGPAVSVVASSNGDGGMGVITTDAGKVTDENNQTFDAGVSGLYRDDFGGTSSAAPLAAGVAALVLSANPNLTAAQVKQILESTADKIGAPNEYDAKGHSPRYGYGRINALRAVQRAQAMIGQGQTALDEMPPIYLRGAGKSSIPVANAGRLFQLTLGSQLIIQAKPLQPGLDVEIFLRKGNSPVPAQNAFDKRGSVQNGVDFIVENGIQLTDYFLLVNAKSGTGSYGLQITLGGAGKALNPSDAAVFGGVLALRLQHVGQARFSGTGESHLYRIALSSRLAVVLDGPDGDASDFDLYVRRNNIPVPQGRQYDESSSDAETSEERVMLESQAIVQSDYFLLVRSVKGAGEFALNVQLG